MTALKHSKKYVKIQVIDETTITVSIYRIQRETSAYSPKHYTIKCGTDRDYMVWRIVQKMRSTWRPGYILYE